MKQHVPLFEAFVQSETDAYYDFDEFIRDECMQIVFDVTDRKMTKQPWKVISFARLKKIWKDSVKTGVIRDDKGLDMIVDIMLTNIARLYINTVLSGHTQESPNGFLAHTIGYVLKGEEKTNTDDEELSMTQDEFNEATDEYFYDENWGQLRISDYAIDPLIKIAIELLREGDYNAKLVLVDKALNVVHQRGDIASLFVEGGSASLDELAGMVEQQEVDYAEYGEAIKKLKKKR